MLFINLDLIIELLGFNIHKYRKENKLKYYDLIANTNLEDDITFNSFEIEILNKLCELEITNNFLIDDNSCDFGIDLSRSYEMERELFTKLFVREYLNQKEQRTDLLLANTLDLKNNISKEVLENNLTGIKLFKDFASVSLKNSKEFSKVILELDGSYIVYMGDCIRNCSNLMEIAINNDRTKEVVSFSKSNSTLLHDPLFAILYLKKMKENQEQEFSVKKIYEEIFIQENGEYTKKIFKNCEQSSWINDYRFLPKLAKISPNFEKLIENGDIGLISEVNSVQKIKR